MCSISNVPVLLTRTVNVDGGGGVVRRASNRSRISGGSGEPEAHFLTSLHGNSPKNSWKVSIIYFENCIRTVNVDGGNGGGKEG